MCFGEDALPLFKNERMNVIKKCQFPYCTETYLADEEDFHVHCSVKCSSDHMREVICGNFFSMDVRAMKAEEEKAEKWRNGVASVLHHFTNIHGSLPSFSICTE